MMSATFACDICGKVCNPNVGRDHGNGVCGFNPDLDNISPLIVAPPKLASKHLCNGCIQSIWAYWERGRK
jgi:hypothetical protein